MDSKTPLSAKEIIDRLLTDSSLIIPTMTLDQVISIALSLVAALLIGVLIYFVYRKFFRGAVFSQTFAITLVGMTVLTCMVTLAISTNVVLSLGMVGALSIVRFRTAVKEPLDLLFLFWAISAGIAMGAGMYYLVGVASVLIIALLVLLSKSKLHTVYIMIVHYTGDDIGDQIKRVLNRTKFNIKSRTMRAQMCEMAVEVYARRDNLAFAEQIRAIEHVEDVTLVQYSGEYHG